MRLSVHWVNATRPHDVRTQVELTYRDTLLEISNGVENAKRAYDHAKACPHHPLQDWHRFNQHALGTATRNLSPTETSMARFQIAFNEGVSNDH